MFKKKWFRITVLLFVVIVGSIIILLKIQVSNDHKNRVIEILNTMGADLVSMDSVNADDTQWRIVE